jgi:hypothetical protein
MMKRFLAGAMSYTLVAFMFIGGLPLRALADEGMLLPDAIASLPLEQL